MRFCIAARIGHGVTNNRRLNVDERVCRRISKHVRNYSSIVHKFQGIFRIFRLGIGLTFRRVWGIILISQTNDKEELMKKLGTLFIEIPDVKTQVFRLGMKLGISKAMGIGRKTVSKVIEAQNF